LLVRLDHIIQVICNVVVSGIQKTSASRESVVVLPFGDDRTYCDQVIVCVEVIARLTQL
jgi:hypothetical protein